MHEPARPAPGRTPGRRSLLTRLAGALALAFLLATPALARTPAPAPAPAPAMWRAQAGQLTVFLFGSMHALPNGTAWQTAPIQAAFDRSDQAWFEAVLSRLDPGLLATVLTEGLDPGRKLSDRLTPPEAARLRQVAATLPAPLTFAMLDSMRPWLAALMIGTARTTGSGFDEQLGVDRTLQARATAGNKPMEAIEDPADTLRAVAALPEPAALSMLREALSPKPESPMLRRLTADWLSGNVPGVARVIQAGLPGDSAIGRALLTRRNAAWAARLAGLKDRHTTIFLTVGVGHLAGPGNLRDLLAKQGFTLARVPTAATTATSP